MRRFFILASSNVVIISRFVSYRILRKGFHSKRLAMGNLNHPDYARFADEELEVMERSGGNHEDIRVLQRKSGLSIAAVEELVKDSWDWAHEHCIAEHVCIGDRLREQARFILNPRLYEEDLRALGVW